MYVVTVSTKSGADSGGAGGDSASAQQALEDFVSHFEELKKYVTDDGTAVVVATKRAAQVVNWSLHALRLRELAVGIGIGEVRADTLQQGPLAGTAVTASKNALVGATKQGQIAPARVEVAYARRAPIAAEYANNAQAVLQLMGHIVANRTQAEWAVIDLMEPGVRGQQKPAAEKLGMTVQAVSQAVKRSLFKNEHQVRGAIAHLLDAAHEKLRDIIMSP